MFTHIYAFVGIGIYLSMNLPSCQGLSENNRVYPVANAKQVAKDVSGCSWRKRRDNENITKAMVRIHKIADNEDRQLSFYRKA